MADVVLLCGHDALCTVYLGRKGLINWTDLNQHINKLCYSGKLFGTAYAVHRKMLLASVDLSKVDRNIIHIFISVKTYLVQQASISGFSVVTVKYIANWLRDTPTQSLRLIQQHCIWLCENFSTTIICRYCYCSVMWELRNIQYTW